MLYFSNFVLELHNINSNKMKKSILIFIVSFLVITGLGFWIYYSEEPFKLGDKVQIIVIGLLVIFAVILGINRFKSTREGLPPEDELSKKITQKAASISYYISLYLWLAIMYIGNDHNEDPERLFGSGIIGMAIVFALSWLYYKFIGLKNE